MTIDLINILVVIVECINKEQSFDKIVERVNKTRTVNSNLVAAIYSWIYEKINKEAEVREENKRTLGIRILSEKEIETFGVDNYNFIMHLFNLGILNNKDIEKIIEQASLFSEGDLDFEQLNLLVLSIFLDSNSDLPPGSRLLLYSSDTIN